METTKYTLSEQEKYRLSAMNAELKKRLLGRSEEETIRALLSLTLTAKSAKREKMGA